MRILITGGAGFVGSNIVEHYLSKGEGVVVLDNLSRPGGGAARNIGDMLAKYGGSNRLRFVYGDVREWGQVIQAMRGVDAVFHAAAQTAMTTSLESPVDDFEVNALGTLNVLEASRVLGNIPVVYFSTNKVYGDLTKASIQLEELDTRWEFKGKFKKGIDESYPIDYEGCYGCSKGIGDAYCLDYAKTFGLNTTVLRMSGMYGGYQYPTEDQGWIAWFVRRALRSEAVVIYGDGKQVRDILYIADLLAALDIILEKKPYGEAFNLGGGRGNSISILELLAFMEEGLGIKPCRVEYSEWRRADQKIYITNIEKATRELGWQPLVSKEAGITKLYTWMKTANGE